MNIFDQIKVKTEHKAPGGEVLDIPDLNESDFTDAPYIPEVLDNGFNPACDTTQNNGTAANTAFNDAAVLPQPQQRVFDPDFTTDIVVDTIDTLQFSVFMALQSRKQKSIRFKDREEYLQAISLNYLTDVEIGKLEEPEDKKLLVQKLKAFQETMAKINQKTNFTPDEIDRLKKPVKQLVKQHNFDIPPGLAFALVITDIISNRVVDLIMD